MCILIRSLIPHVIFSELVKKIMTLTARRLSSESSRSLKKNLPSKVLSDAPCWAGTETKNGQAIRVLASWFGRWFKRHATMPFIAASVTGICQPTGFSGSKASPLATPSQTTVSGVCQRCAEHRSLPESWPSVAGYAPCVLDQNHSSWLVRLLTPHTPLSTFSPPQPTNPFPSPTSSPHSS